MSGGIDPRLDFFVLSGDGAGKHAINMYLNLHPRIFSVRGGAIDEIDGNSYHKGVKHLFRDLALTGWVFTNLRGLIADPQLAERIKASAKPTTMIQLVRDPIRMMLSLYNQRMQRSLANREDLPPEPGRFFEDLTSSARYHEARARLASHFSRNVIFDTTDIAGSNVPATLRRIFDMLGVEANEKLLQHPALLRKQNDIVQTLLRRTSAKVVILGVSIPCRLQLQSSLDFMSMFGLSLEGKRVATPFPAVPEGQPGKVAGWGQIVGVVDNLPAEVSSAIGAQFLLIMVEEDAWTRIDPKIRELIRSTNALAPAARGEILDKFSEGFRRIKSFRPLGPADLEGGLVDRVKSELAADIRALLRVEPTLRQKWDICGDA